MVEEVRDNIKKGKREKKEGQGRGGRVMRMEDSWVQLECR
jgi:hypothetical protein